MIRRTLRQMGFSLIAVMVLALSSSAAGAAPRHQQDQRLPYGTPVHGEITNANSEETWTFDGFEGDLVLIDMRADNTGMLDTYLTLLGPNSDTLMTNDDGGLGLNSRLGPLVLDTSGTYSVIAGRYSGEGGYTLELRSLNMVPTIEQNKPVGGTLDADHAIDYYVLESSEDDAILALTLSNDAGYSTPILELFGPNGLMASTEYQESQQLDPVVPAASERYIVAVTWNPNLGGGPYELVLTTSDVQLLRDGDSQQGEISYEAYTHRHFFRGEEGQRVRITVEADSTLALAVEITSADSYRYLFSSRGETTRRVLAEVDIPVTGLYNVQVSDGAYSGSESTYTVTLEIVEE